MAIGRRKLVGAGVGLALAALLVSRRHGAIPAAAAGVAFPVTHTEAEWRKLLTLAQYNILREQGTESPGSSPLEAEQRPGIYACAGCAHPLFDAATKFDSGTGWPSFWAPLDGAVSTTTDNSLFMERTEVHCATCGGHLGHVFDDGPRPTGLRYCMNGAVLSFHPA